ncbi:tetratricopeptide repeat protein [Allorhodopirellula heiligendammensis]|uniref:Tetratricopeptide repeat protein n=1 Tax=Allorhodopirellula heiligendammensis TaxID=2714739 RepID=A0A5C6C398_9BACT|nr:tetratricopeptide repeat protein [Allorhodopirellula heiligendammensis]TWU18091.1 tetratricopeptide repeat protein [Allorhodopirellula heiligendammensis]
MNQLNRKFLAATLAIIVVGVVAVVVIHHFQFNRQSDFFSQQAKTALLAEDYRGAIRLYQQSLKMDAKNQMTLVGLAESYERVGNFNGSYNISQQLARLAPDDISNRVRLARVSLQIGRFTDAISYLDALPEDDGSLEPKPGSMSAELPPLLGRTVAELKGMLGDAKLGNRDVEGAIEAYREAVATDAASMETYVKLAQTLTDLADLPAEGEVVVNQMVHQFPDRGEAYISRGQWHLSVYGDGLGMGADDSGKAEALQKAVADSETAMKMAAASSRSDSAEDTIESQSLVADSLEFAATVAIADKRPEDAIKWSEEGVKKFPGNGAFYRLTHSALKSLREQAVDPDVQQSLSDRGTSILERGVERLPADAVLLWALASDYLEHDQVESARRITDQLRSIDYARQLVSYLDARIIAARGDVNVAAERMTKVRSDVIERPDLVRLVDLTLSDLYEEMGDTDRQIAVLRRVIANDPLWLPVRERLALAYLRSGRVDEAVQEYSLIANRPDVPIQAPLNYARLLLMQNLGREPGDRDWGPLESLIAILAQQPSFSADVALLNAEILVAQEKPDLARQALATAPGEPRIWSARILLEVTEQDFDAAEEKIAEAIAAIGDSPALRYAQATVATAANRENLAELLSQWSEPPSSWSREEQFELARSIVPLLISNEQYEDAARLASLASEIEPSNVVARLQLMQIAFQWQKADLLREQLAALEKISGRDARWYYGNAMAISLEGAKHHETQEDVALEMFEITAETNARVQESLAEAASQRPDWSLIPAFSATMHDRAGNIETAIRRYNQAVDLGWRNPEMLRRLIQLLTEHGRFPEADSVIRRLRTGSQPFTSEMARIASEVSVEVADLGRAVRLAEEAAESSGAVEDFLWLAQLSEMSKDPKAAGLAYERAMEIAPGAAAPMLAWVGYLERNSRMSEARDALTAYEQTIESDDPSQLLTLADGYQRIGSVDDAARVLRKVPSDSLKGLESYQRYLQIIVAADGPAQGAVRLSRWLGIGAKISSSGGPRDGGGDTVTETEVGDAGHSDRPLDPAVVRWARRQLALLLASSRDPSVYGQAKGLIAENLQEAGAAASTKSARDMAFEDRRAAAIIDAIFRSASEPDLALKQFDSMKLEGWQPSTVDQFVVGELAALTGDWTRGRRWMLPLLSSDELREPMHVKTYVRLLLGNDDAAEAQLWLDKLQDSGVNDEETAELTAEVILRRGNVDRLLELLTIQADELATADSEQQWFATTLSYSQRFDLLNRLTTRLINGIDERSEEDQAAGQASGTVGTAVADRDLIVSRLEQASREMAATLADSGEYPGAGYAMQLLSRGECEAAVKAIDRIASTASQDELVAFADAVLVHPGCDQVYGNLAEILRRVGGEQADNIVYAVLMARLQEAQGDYKRAMQTYDAILRRDPEHFAAMNNLATLLSLRKQDANRALELINRAIELNGETLVTLDTRGVCHLAAGQSKAAVLDFLAAAEMFPHPIVTFHLAQAMEKAGDSAAAAEHLRRAVRAGLKRAELHPLEFAAYDSLMERLGSTPES